MISLKGATQSLQEHLIEMSRSSDANTAIHSESFYRRSVLGHSTFIPLSAIPALNQMVIKSDTSCYAPERHKKSDCNQDRDSSFMLELNLDIGEEVN